MTHPGCTRTAAFECGPADCGATCSDQESPVRDEEQYREEGCDRDVRPPDALAPGQRDPRPDAIADEEGEQSRDHKGDAAVVFPTLLEEGPCSGEQDADERSEHDLAYELADTLAKCSPP